MDDEPVITKRLYISGLTPALTASDISQRLSSFGTIKAVDGFGLLDGVGRQRKFGYITLETTASKFAKCCNTLSGSTWKGTKLRIGEAKPDFRERIAAENVVSKRTAEQLEEADRARKNRKIRAVHATDMSPVTKENAGERPGWVVTSQGRIVRPMLMRPPRPLIEPDAKIERGKGQKADVRARRRTIDMLKCGSVHLKGVFVDVAVPRGYAASKDDVPPIVPELEGSSDEDGDVDMTEAEVTEGGAGNSGDSSGENEDEENENLDGPPPEGSISKDDIVNTTNKLKELFAPQEENGFSLLGHLDLDLELDEDIPFATTTEEPQSRSLQDTEMVPITVPTSSATQARSNRTVAPIQLDPKKPLFFPLPSSSTLGGPNKGRLKDIFDVAKEKGWNWRDPSVAFYRTETEDEIRKRWEESKGELTREWKRRWKEAGKISRRKFGSTTMGDGDLKWP